MSNQPLAEALINHLLEVHQKHHCNSLNQLLQSLSEDVLNAEEIATLLKAGLLAATDRNMFSIHY